MKIEAKTYEELNYLTCFPKGFSENKTYPVIIHLHGAGSRGQNPEVLKEQSIVRYALQQEDFPFVMFLPQCKEKYWDDVFEQLKRLVHYLKSLPFVDSTQIFLSGVSMGGIASWQFLISDNTVFQKAIICCGAGHYWRINSVTAKVWAFHGTEDRTAVPFEAGKKMVDAMKQAKKDVKFTVYEGVGHNIWDKTYFTPEIYQWLLS